MSKERQQPQPGWLPHPVLTLALVLLWLLLLNELSFGGVLMGIVLGVAIPRLTAGFWPDRPRIRGFGKIVEYFLIVSWDILVANVQVAWLIVFRSAASLNTCWVVVPLALRQPEAITLLAGTVTMTPGTVSCDLSADGCSLLVHCLDAPDPDAVVSVIKHRYENRLKEIFS